jgi:2-oxoglutarate dehydrogenase E1 component
LERIVNKPLGYIGREESSSPATGFPAIYKQEQQAIIEKAMMSPVKRGGQAAVS